MVAGYQRVGKITRWVLGVTAIVSIITGHVIASKAKKEVKKQTQPAVATVCKFKLAFVDEHFNDLTKPIFDEGFDKARAEHRLNQFMDRIMTYNTRSGLGMHIKKEIQKLNPKQPIKVTVSLAEKLSKLPSGEISRKNLISVRDELIRAVYQTLYGPVVDVIREYGDLGHSTGMYMAKFIAKALETPEWIVIN
ncbi:thiamine biosynthesis related protein, putative [Babesia ovis]|uniref:Thiamine biosynthesis related protein, putative n=1 Tax=Babesia ovis TaxID=5869 RepID=A0A9W5TDQ6_BABOV|nr:thiamine biosynthesis related protein, putative [Babesia ovis]